MFCLAQFILLHKTNFAIVFIILHKNFFPRRKGTRPKEQMPLNHMEYPFGAHRHVGYRSVFIILRLLPQVKIRHGVLLGKLAVHPDINPGKQGNRKGSHKACAEHDA